MSVKNYDAIVVGSGPNGLAAAITLQQQGLSVLLLEAKTTVGGGMRTEALTIPGFQHDVCSAVHPMAIHSPFLLSLPLEKFGLEYIQAPVQAAHPFDNGTAAVLTSSLEQTASLLKGDEKIYLDLIGSIVADWPYIVNDLLGPLRFPASPLKLARFGIKTLRPATAIAKKFTTPEAKGLWAGMAAHAIQPLTNISTAAIGLVLAATAHLKGWPIPKGGSHAIAAAMAGYFISLGGVIETGQPVLSIDELPAAKAILFDVTPRQLLKMAGNRFSSFYKKQLQHYRYGMGVFKVDWALDGSIPFTAEECKSAGTVHLGGHFEEIVESEYKASKGLPVHKPFVLLSQPSLFDASRAPEGKHTAWAYCHVPNGSQFDMTDIIENQVERFAPGFKKKILARHTMNTAQMQAYNPNYIGGDINGGIMDTRQLFTRPVFRFPPYSTSAKNIFICSSSTPPGGGVHGMCGFHAARTALKEVFNIKQ